MNDVSTTPTPAVSNTALVDYVLRARRDPARRAALRRGAHPATRMVARPMLDQFARNHGDSEADYRFAALCASFPKIAHNPNMAVGRALRLTKQGSNTEDGPVARRLLAAQRQPLNRVDTTLRSMLNLAEPSSLDWTNLYWLLVYWDHPDLTTRTNRRQDLLRHYYRHSNTDDDSSPTDTDQPDSAKETKTK